MTPLILPAINPNDYEGFRDILKFQIPNTYDEWLHLHAKWQAEYLLDGEPVVQVEVKPHEFSRYLDATGCANDLNNLLIFAVKIANGNHY